MIAYKAFDIGLKCRGYQFFTDKVNVTDKANCAQNGFHCAENPLDCLTYYSNWDAAEYWIVEAYGDIDEDNRDSKISCTHMKLVKKLTLKAFVAESLKYIYSHPKRENTDFVYKNEAEADNLFAIARGLNPIASGKKGTVLGFAKENSYGRVIEIAMIEIDGAHFKEDTFYDIQGNEAYPNLEVLND